MEFLVTAIAFLVIFSALVLIHEWGHFYAARRAGVKVEEFGFGLPPRIWGKRKGETLYSLNWIPFGGFVKLLGEDAHDEKLLKDKRSFSSKKPRVRLLIIVAGVLMNFILAWFLLTIGFTFGIQPLIVGPEDVLQGLRDGSIQTRSGIVVKTAGEQTGLNPGDRIVAMDGREILYPEDLQAEQATYEVERQDGTRELMALQREDFTTYELLHLPRVFINEVKAGSASEEGGLRPGDMIVRINEEPIYFAEEYEQAVRQTPSLQYAILRDGQEMGIKVLLPEQGRAIISNVIAETPAEAAGVQKGDVVLSANGDTVFSPQELIAITQSSADKEVLYRIRRGDETLELLIKPNEMGLIGVGLSTVDSFENQELSVYGGDAPVSVLKIDDVRYPVWIAPIKALEETGRLSLLTVQMFGNVIQQLATQFTVPEGVAGPVGIAQLTHVFVQEGLLSVLRFMAILSLSLAIINILPFPALDGGRAFFILAEVLFGRRMGVRSEAFIHAVGFLVLMALILAVTYNDVVRWLWGGTL